MTNKITTFLLALSAGALLAIGAASAATNPVVGTWEMNAAKSTIDNGPKSETFTFASSDKGITLTSNVTGADGKQTSHASDPSPWDGVAHSTTDSKDHDAVMAKAVAPGIYRYSFTKAGAVVNSGTLAVSKDGNTLTIAGSRTGAKGARGYYNIVFDRK
jgi:hypothetical protein